jgi:hypothetical protein
MAAPGWKARKMSDKLTIIEPQNVPTLFDPERHRLKVAAINYGIEEAKRIKNWPALETAVDQKIDEQRQFIGWWDASVRDKGERGKSPGTRLFVAEAEQLTGMKQQRVSDLGRRLGDPDKYRDFLLGTEYRAAMLMALDNVRGTTGTGENEWFTPKEYIDRARAVLGAIDLDPATHEQAQTIVQAAHYFTKDDDGLAHEWHGRVWLNPPYAQPAIAHFISKLCTERKAGNQSAARGGRRSQSCPRRAQFRRMARFNKQPLFVCSAAAARPMPLRQRRASR